MTSSAHDAVEQLLVAYKPPYLNQTLADARAVKRLDINDGRVEIDIELGYPVASVAVQIKSDLQPQLLAVEGVDQVAINVTSKVIAHQSQNNMKSMANVRNIVAVASGKGGVGKSTTTVNLALAMAAEGAKVGILDADIYGPSQGKMLGIPAGQRPQPADKGMYPISAHGVQAMSIAFLVDEDQPMVWRGPMVSGALQQLLTDTQWEDLDYLFVDMPPGTGDIQLTLSQKVPVTGALIVTTPQDIALLDAKKGIEMFRKVEIPVFGIIENMSTHTCSNCGHNEAIFGEGGGERIAEQYDTDLLGRLPLTMGIRQQADCGEPTVVAKPESEEAAIYRDIVLKLAGSLAAKGKNYANVFPEIVVQND
ncbi:MAG: iron-sulfur cluster carrier protein ApbC [Motiliproteus sp.]